MDYQSQLDELRRELELQDETWRKASEAFLEFDGVFLDPNPGLFAELEHATELNVLNTTRTRAVQGIRA